MSRRESLLAVVAGFGLAGDLRAQDVKGLEIRSSDGKVVVAADEIVSYAWTTHTLTLKDGIRKALAERFKRIAPRGSLNSGIPFDVTVDGKKMYGGIWKSCVSSISSPAVVIVWDGRAIDPALGEDQLRIELGYPSPQHFKGDDPRGDERVKKALAAGKKLK